MRIRFVTVPFLLLAAAVATTAADTPPRVSRPLLATLEKSLDGRIAKLWDDNPMALLGSARGVYLEGFGAVFSAEVNVVMGGATLMHLQWTQADKDQHLQKKIGRLPQLKRAMKQALMETAAAPALDAVPLDEQVYLAVFLWRYAWEDAAGSPSQMILQAPKRKLVEAKRAGGKDTALNEVVRVTEY